MPASISELRQALQNQRLDVEIMRCIARLRSPNVSSIADELGKDRKTVRFHFYKLKAVGCLRDRWVRMRTRLGIPILCHELQLTKKGERLLREGGLIFPVSRLDDASPDIDGNTVASSEHERLLSLTRAETRSEVNWPLTKQAADTLDAPKLAMKRPRHTPPHTPMSEGGYSDE